MSRYRNGKGLFIDYPSEAIIDCETGERYYDGIKPNYVSSKEVCNLLNALTNENEQLKTKYQELKYFMTHSEPVTKQKELQKLIYQIVVNMIEDKIKDVTERKGYLFKPNEADAVISVLNELKEELE